VFNDVIVRAEGPQAVETPMFFAFENQKAVLGYLGVGRMSSRFASSEAGYRIFGMCD